MNDQSDNIFVFGSLTGGAISAFGYPEVGVPLIGFSAASSTAVDITTTGICFF